MEKNGRFHEVEMWKCVSISLLDQARLSMAHADGGDVVESSQPSKGKRSCLFGKRELG